MSSIRWSALFLSMAAPFACAPHYDVGDTDGNGAEGGEGVGGSSAGGTGGSSMETGGSSGTNGSGGKSMTGGSGGSGEVGGSSAGGTDATGGTGGSPVAGSAGSAGEPMMPPPEYPCGKPAELEYGTLAAPDVVWERISQFLFGELRNPPAELAEETTPEWAVEMLRAALARSRFTSASGQQALIPFMQKFLGADPAGAVGDPPHEFWARVIGAPDSRLGDLFAGDEESNPPFGLFGTIAAQYDGLSARGAFIAKRLFCSPVDAPPFDVEPVVPLPGQTRREALAAELKDPSCAGCHAQTDPPAFPLEVLTPGTLEYRTTENGKPIDTSGSWPGSSDGNFPDLASMGEQLAVSCEVAQCFTRQLFSEAVPGVDPTVTFPVELSHALYRFAAPDSPEAERFEFQTLLEAIVASPSFLE